MAELIFPLQYKRQYNAALDVDMVFNTDAELQAYLTNPRRYSGQTATCLEHEGNLYILNNQQNNWFVLNGSGSTPTTSGSSYNKVSFGNILTNSNSYPIFHSYDRAIRFHNHLSTNFEEHNKFLFDISYDNGTQFLEQQFDNIADLTSFLNVHTPYSGNYITSQYIVECYAKQIPEIGAISKIYGLNTFYSCLKGKGAYKKNYKTAYESLYTHDGHFTDKREDFITKVWEHFTFNGFINAGNIENAARAIWFSQTPANVYGLFKNGHTIRFPNGEIGNRYSFNWGDSSFHTHGTYDISVTDSAFVFLMTGNNIQVSSSISDNEYYNNEIISMIKIYKLEGTDGSGDNRTAIYVKPVGQDVFRLNHISNISGKSLYAIYYEGDNDHQPIIKRLNAELVDNIWCDVSYMIEKQHWSLLPAIASSQMKMHIGHSKQKKFRFFIGDDNGNISQFSPEVTPFCFRSGAKQKTLIRSL